jgi:hypothetical protein
MFAKFIIAPVEDVFPREKIAGHRRIIPNPAEKEKSCHAKSLSALFQEMEARLLGNVFGGPAR